MTNSSEKQFTEELAKVYREQDDLAEQAKAIIEAAEVAGHKAKAIKKVAKELNMDSDKLRKRFEEEEQLDMFRAASGLFHMKGLDTTTKAETAFSAQGERRLEESAQALDAVAGTDIAKNYRNGKAAIRNMVSKREASP